MDVAIDCTYTRLILNYFSNQSNSDKAMTDETPVMIAVAPNGARKTRLDHPNLPLTPRELAATAAACLAAGACMIHLHVRDSRQRHSLDPHYYLEATSIIRGKVGSDMIIQITTEAVGLYTAQEQMRVVREVRPEAVSLAIREICPPGCDETKAAEFFAWLLQENISPQYILYSRAEIQRFNDLKTRGIIPLQHDTILLALGRYAENQQSNPDDLRPLLVEVSESSSWWVCAFGATESECLAHTIKAGGHCRVGFENNMLLPDGSIAPSNEILVAQVALNAGKHKRPVATAEIARDYMAL
jgi:uncharacterized protein (DUF849 family)